MKKLKILYDTDWLIHTWQGKTVGAGIYYTAYNVLKQLNLRDDIEICAFSSTRNFGRLRFAIKEGFPLPNLKQVKLDFLSELFAKCQYYRYCSVKNNKSAFFARLIRAFVRIVLQNPIRKLNNHFETYKHIADSFDCYFSPIYKAPQFIAENKRIKKLTVLYDAIPLMFPKINTASPQNSWYMNLVRSIKNDDYFFTISDSSKADLIKNIPAIDKNKIFVIPLAANSNFYPNIEVKANEEIRKKYNIPKDIKYFLSVCTIEPRKNLVFAVSNFLAFIKKNNIEDLVLVLAGGHWKKLSPEVVAAIDEFGSADKIIQTGYVDEKDLASLYSNAECFVYPSLYEGFGLPPLEAMQCGTPVITSNTSSLPEVVGDAAIMIDPHDDEALIQSYERMYYDDSLRDELSKKGIERAKLFSWEKCADIIVNKMKEVCGEV